MFELIAAYTSFGVGGAFFVSKLFKSRLGGKILAQLSKRIPGVLSGTRRVITRVRGRKYKSDFDTQTRVVRMEGPAVKADIKDRRRSQQRRLTEGRGKDFHAGHLISDEFGDPGGLENLVPMKPSFNNGAWKREVENPLRNIIRHNKNVRMTVNVKYSERSASPSSFTVKVKYTKPNGQKVTEFLARNLKHE